MYREIIVEFEEVFGGQPQAVYRRLEKRLDEERLTVLKKTLISELTQENLFKAMDAILEYLNRFIKDGIQELGIFPEDYDRNMMEYYERKKREILGK